MDSKEGIEQVMPVDARAAGLLDPSLLWSGTDDAAMANPPREWAGGSGGSPTLLGENPRRESCCLYIQVLRDSDVVLEQDRKVSDYCWNAGICKDICEAQTRVLPGAFSVETHILLLSTLTTKRDVQCCQRSWNIRKQMIFLHTWLKDYRSRQVWTLRWIKMS